MTPEITNSAAATLVSTPALVEAFKALVAGALGGLLTHGLTRLRDRANLNSERRSLAAAAAAELRAMWAKSLATERAREWDEGYTRDVVDWGDSSFDATPLVSAATAKAGLFPMPLAAALARFSSIQRSHRRRVQVIQTMRANGVLTAEKDTAHRIALSQLTLEMTDPLNDLTRFLEAYALTGR